MRKMAKLVMGAVFGGLLVTGFMFLNGVKDVDVVKENGYMVLEDNSKSDSTIVAKITGTEGKDYNNAVNVYDKKDTIVLDKGFKKGDIVLITFNGDDVVKVEKNELNIGDKVEGQKIIK